MTRRKLIHVLLVLISWRACQSRPDPIENEAEHYTDQSLVCQQHDNKSFGELTFNTDNIYISRGDIVMQLTNNFSVSETVIPPESTTTRNLPRIMVISESTGQLVTCDSDEKCQTRDLRNISVIRSSWNSSGDVRDNDNSAEDFTMVGQIAPGEDGMDSLYVARTTRVSNVPIFERTLNGTIVRKTNTISSSVLSDFAIRYSNSFVYDGFVYFLASQWLKPRETDTSFVIKLSRLPCRSDYFDFDTFTEIVLPCRDNDSSTYSIVRAAKLYKKKLFIVSNVNADSFGYSPSNRSAFCIYNMSQLEKSFEKATRLCGCGWDGNPNNYLKDASCFSKFPRDIVRCTARSANFSHNTFDFFKYAQQDPDYPTVVDPAVIIRNGSTFTSIAITTVPHQHDQLIAFIGSIEGEILKVKLSNVPVIYEVVHVGTPILEDTALSADEETLLVLTESKVLKMKVADCDQFMTCGDCVRPGTDLGDPYCGWCSDENRCTRYTTECSDWLHGSESLCPKENSSTVTQKSRTTKEIMDNFTDGNVECISYGIPDASKQDIDSLSPLTDVLRMYLAVIIGVTSGLILLVSVVALYMKCRKSPKETPQPTKLMSSDNDTEKRQRYKDMNHSPTPASTSQDNTVEEGNADEDCYYNFCVIEGHEQDTYDYVAGNDAGNGGRQGFPEFANGGGDQDTHSCADQGDNQEEQETYLYADQPESPVEHSPLPSGQLSPPYSPGRTDPMLHQSVIYDENTVEDYYEDLATTSEEACRNQEIVGSSRHFSNRDDTNNVDNNEITGEDFYDEVGGGDDSDEVYLAPRL